MRVQAVLPGYFGNQQIEVGDYFDIPNTPLNKETGLPIAFSDSRKRVAPGRSGWMKPYDAENEALLAKMEADFKKAQAAPTAAPAGKPEGKPAGKPEDKK